MSRNPLLEAIARDLLKVQKPVQMIVDNSGNHVATVTFTQPDMLTPEPIIESKPDRRLDFSL